MSTLRGKLLGLASGAAALTLVAGGALADGMPGSVKDSKPADEGRAFAFSWNIGATTDYIFRGVSQSAEKPAFQLGADMTYGIFYAGMWGSYIDFGNFTDAVTGNPSQIGGFAEVDFYAGIKPVLGPVTFDLGVIYYAYPGARDSGSFNELVLTGRPYEFDYVEGKLGASGSFVKNLTTGVTLFYSPEYTNKQGSVWTVEGTAAYELPKFWVFTPTVGGTLGQQFGSFNVDKFNALEETYFAANGKDSYMYWNVGLALAVDKLTLDFRYWDTNIKNEGTVTGLQNFCKGSTFQCDERFVFSAKLTF